MTVWRITAGIGLGLLLGLPLLQPFVRLLEPATWNWTADDLLRVGWLAGNTLLLVSGTCLLAVPAGTLLAVLLFRTHLPGRRVGLALVVFLLFVPLPVIVSAWQSFLGSGGLLPLQFWTSGVDRPWATGWGPAIWVHAVAATPWVACIVGLGLQWVEPELEETAALQLPPWRVVCQVTLPRCRASIVAALVFVGLQTASEISVTTVMLISTLADEVFTQFTLGEEALGRTLLLSLPVLLALTVLLCMITARLERRLPPLPALLRPSLPLRLSPGWVWLAVLVVVFALLMVPAAGLVWKLGEAGTPPRWSLVHALNQLAGETWLLGGAALRSLLAAVLCGALVGAIALTCCWLATDSAWLRLYLLVLLMAAWVTPGPVVGIGLKELILALPDGPWLDLLYSAPSPLPIIWAHVIRFLPAAIFFLWPVVRVIPRELIEAARLEGAGPVQELMLVVWPMTRSAVGVIAIAVTALALGEHEAAGSAATPQWESFAKLLFDRMHYGTDSTVAALSLLLLGSVLAALLAALSARWLLKALGASKRSNHG
jgi:iron(III) transport system permease protein